jgi:hypothetical protein
LTTLDSRTAESLASFQGRFLCLSGLTTIDESTAKVLATSERFLYLDGLTSLSISTARALASHRGGMSLSGLEKIDVDVAKALTAYPEHLDLSGLASLDADTAKEIVMQSNNSDAPLYLDGLTKIDISIAKALAEYRGQELSLTGLTNIDRASLMALTKIKQGKIDLRNIKTISEESAKILIQLQADMEASLILSNGTGNIPVKLAKNKDEITLDVDALMIDAKAVENLAEFHPQFLLFPNLKKLDAETASVLANLDCIQMQFPSLEMIDCDTVNALRSGKSELFLASTIILGPNANNTKARFDGTNISVDPIHVDMEATLDLESARSIADCDCDDLRINGSVRLSPEAASAILKFGGFSLQLGLQSLSLATARAISESQVEDLRITELTELDSDTADIISRFIGKNLVIEELSTLSPETAKPLAAFRGNLVALKVKNLPDETRKLLMDSSDFSAVITDLNPPYSRVILYKDESLASDIIEELQHGKKEPMRIRVIVP